MGKLSEKNTRRRGCRQSHGFTRIEKILLSPIIHGACRPAERDKRIQTITILNTGM